eukprot:TRINITY_DN1834_c0_g1_i2.p1 TRINITY_DN1834_c0_g1~~TRINITY_DN1834_c0_g1_i2.p1  ORF type:complete len:322 (+),score=38.75 TRINITY_DN1834_c0_g1_i2:33-998(+)
MGNKSTVASTSSVDTIPEEVNVDSSVSWEYQNEGEWVLYDKRTIRLIEGMCSKGLPFTTLNFGEWAKSKGGYLVDFTKMTSTQKETGKCTAIRRQPPLKVRKSKVLEQLNTTSSSGFSDPGRSKLTIVSKLTQWKDITSSIEGNCTICMDTLSSAPIVQLSQCSDHYFHKNCIVHCYKNNFLICPNCGKTYGVRVGNQPKGTMNVTTLPPGSVPLSGYPNTVGTIQINYNFPNGKQGSGHPNPGESYEGTSRTCYLPDDEEGKEILRLLKIAWDRKLIFRIGTSVTTGKPNQVIWNGIHHKTSATGGFQVFFKMRSFLVSN